MKASRIQVILPDEFVDKFEKERKNQKRSKSNFGWFCIRFYFDYLKEQEALKKSA